jgi:chromosome segregation ATPase
MAIEDYVTDIKKLKAKGADKLTATDKQKIKRFEQQLKTNYAKLDKACSTYTKNVATQISKLKKKQDAIIAKTEKAEKMKRSTDKLDRERLTLIGEISTLNYQLDVAEKVLACPEAKKLIPTLGQ